MKEITLFHGTNIESYNSIIKNGFKSGIVEIFNCSYSGQTFFFPQQNESNALKMAIGNAAISAAVMNQQTTDLGVFKIKVKKELFDLLFEKDTTAGSMIDIAYCVNNIDLNKYINSGDIKFTKYLVPESYIPEYRFAYLTGIETSLMNLTPEEESMTRIVAGSSSEEYFDVINEINDLQEDYKLIKSK